MQDGKRMRKKKQKEVFFWFVVVIFILRTNNNYVSSSISYFGKMLVYNNERTEIEQILVKGYRGCCC